MSSPSIQQLVDFVKQTSLSNRRWEGTTPLKLYVEDEFHRTTRGGAGGVKNITNYAPDRLTVSPEVYPNLSISMHKIYKDGGVGAFYYGISPTLIGMLPYSTCYYFMYDTIKKSVCLAKKKESLTRAEMLLVGALSGLTDSTISYPLEVARK